MTKKRVVSLVCAVCWLAPLPAASQVVWSEFLTQSGTVVINLDGTVPASELQLGLVWLAPAWSKADGSVNSLQCLGTARRRGELVRGISVTLEGELFDEEGDTLKILSRKTRPFNPAARFSWDLPDYSAGHVVIGVMLDGGLVGSAQVDYTKIACRAINRFKCRSDSRTLCLVGNNRFKVQLDWGSGQGRVKSRTMRTGWFAMTNPNQSDVYVEIVDRCNLNDHYWVAVASMTKLGYKVVVEDTLSGETRAFSNPGSNMVMVDSAAFPTCP